MFIQKGEVKNDRCVLAVTNDASAEINSMCSQQFAGQAFSSYSADSVYHDEDSCRFPVEFLNNLRPPGIPDHCLVLKPGMPLMLLRNLDPKQGLCNGVRLIFSRMMGQRIIVAKTSSDQMTKEVFIPRINLIIDETVEAPLKWRRRQFPVRPAFAQTINKVQGQTLDRVGVWLEFPVFSHGQFYVAASRVKDPKNVRFFICKEGNENCSEATIFSTRNVVYTEVLS